MPFRSFYDLRFLIEDELPRLVRNALAKGDARRKWYRDLIWCDRPDMLALVSADNIVLAMKDVRCQTDADDFGETRDACIPRFPLRH